MKVIVVDDNFNNIVAISGLLKRVDLEVLSAERGEWGVTLLRETPDVDLVLVDIMMPGMDGYATMRAMRELPAGDEVPLIAYTVKVDPGERERCLDAGASAYVTKPVDTAELLQVLGKWLPTELPPIRDASALEASPGSLFTPPESNGNGAVTPTPEVRALKPLPALDHPARTALTGMKVMVVDDDFRSVFAIAALLKRLHVHVVSAESGEQGIALLKQIPDVDLVLVDIMMPGVDGYQTMRAMRKLPSTARIPLVAFTAKVADGERQRCIDAGASAYIPKPIDTAQLIEVLGEWLPATRPVERPQDGGA
jgi:CheY-like chemotaxis protein